MKKLSITLLLLTAALLLTVMLLSAAPTGFSMAKSVIGSGGDSSSNTYAISGTMGQGVTAVSSSPTYSIASGYWTGSSLYTLYLPTVLK